MNNSLELAAQSYSNFSNCPTLVRDGMIVAGVAIEPAVLARVNAREVVKWEGFPIIFEYCDKLLGPHPTYKARKLRRIRRKND